MWSWVGAVVAVVLAVGLILFVALVVTLRTGFPPALVAIRRMNRRFWNRQVLKTAGKPGDSTSVVCHVGRRSGTSYRTPIAVVPSADGLIVALPYGMTGDWVKNVVAAGGAVIETDGRSYPATDPQIVAAADVERHFSRKDRLSHRIFGLDQFLVLAPASADVPVGDQ